MRVLFRLLALGYRKTKSTHNIDHFQAQNKVQIKTSCWVILNPPKLADIVYSFSIGWIKQVSMQKIQLKQSKLKQAVLSYPIHQNLFIYPLNTLNLNICIPNYHSILKNQNRKRMRKSERQ